MIADYLVGKVGCFILRILEWSSFGLPSPTGSRLARQKSQQSESGKSWRKEPEATTSSWTWQIFKGFTSIKSIFFWGYPNPFLRRSCERLFSNPPEVSTFDAAQLSLLKPKPISAERSEAFAVSQHGLDTKTQGLLTYVWPFPLRYMYCGYFGVPNLGNEMIWILGNWHLPFSIYPYSWTIWDFSRPFIWKSQLDWLKI